MYRYRREVETERQLKDNTRCVDKKRRKAGHKINDIKVVSGRQPRQLRSLHDC